MTTGLVLRCSHCNQANRIPRGRLGARAHCGRCKGVVLEAGAVVEVDGFDDLQRVLDILGIQLD